MLRPEGYDEGTCAGACQDVKHWGVETDELLPNRVVYPMKKMLTFSESLAGPRGQSPVDWTGRVAVLGRLDNQVAQGRAPTPETVLRAQMPAVAEGM